MFNWIDYTFLGIIIFSSMVGLSRGFIRELFSLITWVGGIWIAFHFANSIEGFLTTLIKSATLRVMAAFGIIFIMVLIVGAVINYFLRQLIFYTGLGGTDRIIGILFGALRAIMIITILLILVRLTPVEEESFYKESILIPHFQPIETWLFNSLPSSFQAYLTPKNN